MILICPSAFAGTLIIAVSPSNSTVNSRFSSASLTVMVPCVKGLSNSSYTLTAIVTLPRVVFRMFTSNDVAILFM